MGNIFEQDFRDFIQAINDNNVNYVLVGGYSVIFHGYSRTTGDMDIWVQRNPENYQKLISAFKQFGMSVFDMTEDNFLNHPTWDVFSFGVPPVCIDIMIDVKGLNFNDCYTNSQLFIDDELQVRVLSMNDLLEAKKKANRPKDIDDINNLIK